MPFSCAASSAATIWRARCIAVGNGEAPAGQRQAPQALIERLALDELHHQRQDAVLPLEAVDRGDVWMVERREDPCLALEAGDAIGVRDKRGRQCLQGDVAAQANVVRPIHFTHAACAEQISHLVRTDPSAGLKRHD